ncbi:MAG: hypothetical protein AAGD00_02130 [Planctomycetota bacterium]
MGPATMPASETSRPDAPPPTRAALCAYCGEEQASAAFERCHACGGLREPLSRQATQNEMGPWQVRNASRPFQPGCSFDTLTRMVDRGRVTRDSVVRGPTTHQFWTRADRTPGVAVLLGVCHACARSVRPSDATCAHCSVVLAPAHDRDSLGLGERRAMPGSDKVDAHVPLSARVNPKRRGAGARVLLLLSLLLNAALAIGWFVLFASTNAAERAGDINEQQATAANEPDAGSRDVSPASSEPMSASADATPSRRVPVGLDPELVDYAERFESALLLAEQLTPEALTRAIEELREIESDARQVGIEPASGESFKALGETVAFLELRHKIERLLVDGEPGSQ